MIMYVGSTELTGYVGLSYPLYSIALNLSIKSHISGGN